MSKSFRIGVLLPQSKQYPSIGKEFMKGLRLGAAQSDDFQFDFKIEGIGFGENPKGIIDSLQKLINQEDVFLTTGLLGHKGTGEVAEFVSGMGEKLILSDLGATLPFGLVPRDGVYINSFDLTKSVNLLGGYFAQHGIKNVATSTCYYDCGYGFTEALERGINADESETQFAGHFITPLTPRENEAELMATFMDETQPEAVFCSHNGVFAKEHADFVTKNGVSNRVKMYATPFSVGNEILENYPETFHEVQCVSSWLPELNTSENKHFVEQYREENGKEPSIFALLGYENALMILNQLESDSERKGPRGSLSIDPKTNRTNYPHYLWEITYENNAYNKKQKTALEENQQDVIEQVIGMVDETSNTHGWFNAYLCH